MCCAISHRVCAVLAGTEDEDVFDVEEITAHRKGKGGRWEFCVKWHDYDELTWEPEANLGLHNTELIAYLATHPLE